jgi:xanthine dehydrogenase YagT iron-sulfur-binding subunit
MKKRKNKDQPERLTRSEHELSRRAFLEGTGAAIVVATAIPSLEAQAPAPPAPPAIAADATVPRTTIRLTVNGTAHRVEVEDRWTLVELLRDRLGLTGTKIGCDRGECGACTVLMDDKPVYSCSQLAVWADGKSITTVEGLAKNGVLTPLQQAFIEHDAPQCGFCTSGQLMTATALLAANPRPSAEQARDAMYGNLCRCANYNRYVEAVVAAGSAASRTTAGGAR